jgi:hypothetical protein
MEDTMKKLILLTLLSAPLAFAAAEKENVYLRPGMLIAYQQHWDSGDNSYQQEYPNIFSAVEACADLFDDIEEEKQGSEQNKAQRHANILKARLEAINVRVQKIFPFSTNRNHPAVCLEIGFDSANPELAEVRQIVAIDMETKNIAKIVEHYIGHDGGYRN